jgi:steroid delta-isomerase-like uncharacterized protein
MPTAKARANAELVRSAFDAVNKHDIDTIVELDSPDVVEDVLAGETLYGKEGVRQYFEELFASLPDASVTVERVVTDDTTAVVTWRLQGNFTGAAFQGVEATGRPMDVRGVDVMEIKNGHIDRNTIYYDGLGVARQMGLLPRKNSSADRAMVSIFNLVTKLRERLR